MNMLNDKGMTLIEALIAIVILSVGILVVGAMQTNSVRANATAIARSQAHAVASSFIEVLQQVPFDSIILLDSDGNGVAGLDDGSPNGGVPSPDPTQADYAVQSSDFQSGGVFAGVFGSVYGISGNTLTDGRGWQYQVFWNVADLVTAAGGTTKVVRMFVYWTSPMGRNSMVLTTMKYQNIAL